jgi:CRP/FNR family transcriptional regulator, cyclic AMP receptor protein
VVRVRASDTIYLRGAPGTGMMAIISGEVKISVTGTEGRQVILTHMGEGEIFGEIGLLDGGERTADVEATTDTELLAIDRRDFLPYLERHPRIANKLLVALCQKLRRTTEQVEDLALLDLARRLAKCLLGLAGGNGRVPRKAVISTVPTQGELAAMMGTSRESINRQLAHWQRDGLLRLSPGSIVIEDAAALQRIVEA